MCLSFCLFFFLPAWRNKGAHNKFEPITTTEMLLISTEWCCCCGSRVASLFAVTICDMWVWWYMRAWELGAWQMWIMIAVAAVIGHDRCSCDRNDPETTKRTRRRNLTSTSTTFALLTCACDSTLTLLTQHSLNAVEFPPPILPCDLQPPTAKPGFHSNAIACVACVAWTKTTRNASVCVGKQPIMVATASTEHSCWLALAFVAWKFHATNASARLRLNGNRASVVIGQQAQRRVATHWVPFD